MKTTREFWTEGFPAPARNWKSSLFRILAHIYLIGVSLTNRLLTAIRGKADPVNAGARKLNILAIGPFFSENWIAAHLEALAGSHSVAEVAVITPESFRPIDSLRYVEFSPRVARWLGDGWARVIAAAGQVRRSPPDLIIGYHLPWNGLASLLLARACRAQAYYFSVGGPAEFLGGGCYSEHALFTRIGRESPALEARFIRLIRQFDTVLTMGSRSRALIEQLGIGIPVVPISVGVSGAKFVQHEGSGEFDYDLVTVGRLARIKRVDLLLQALANIPGRDKISVAVVGDGREADTLRTLARSLGIQASVHFLGWQNEVESILSRSRIFVMSSASEGLPLALIEAMLSGLPAIVPDVGDISDLVVDDESGHLFVAGDTDALATAIERLLGEPDRLGRLSQQARRAALRYTVEARSAGWDELFGGKRPGE